MDPMFKVLLPSEEALFQLLSFPIENSLLGECCPGKFIESVKTFSSSNGEFYALRTQIAFSKSLNKKWPDNFDPIKASLIFFSDAYKILKSEEYQINNTGKTNVEILKHGFDGKLYAYASLYYKEKEFTLCLDIGTSSSVSIPHKFPKSDFERFKFDIAEYVNIILSVVNSLYVSLKMTYEDGAFLSLKPSILIISANGLIGSPNNVLKSGKEMSENKGELEQKSKEGKDDLITKIMITEPVRKFSDVGGQSEAVEEMKALAYGLKNPQIYKDYGVEPVRKILLAGPPGTGKSLLAEALAEKAKVKYYCISATDFISKWVGDAEKNIQFIFDTADENGPSIIFFDEIDAITQERNSSTNEVTSRVIAAINMNLSGMRCKKNVCFVAATNKIDLIDDAIIRAGRFDRIIRVNLPNQKGREDILKIHLRMVQENSCKQVYDPEEIDFNFLARNMKGKSGADIKEVVRRTIDREVRRILKGGSFALVTTQLLFHQIENYEARKEEKKYKRVQGFGMVENSCEIHCG